MPAARIDTKRFTTNRALWQRIYAIGRPYRRSMVLVLALSFVSTLILLSYPLIYATLIDDITSANKTSRLWLFALGILALTGAHLFVRNRFAHRTGRLYGQIGTDLQTRLFDRLQVQPVGFFKVSNTGAITARVVDESAAAANVYRDVLESVIGNAITMVLATIAICILDWRGIFAVISLAALMIPGRRFGRRFRQAAMEEFFTAADLKSFSVERLSADGNQLTTLYGTRDAESSSFRRRAEQLWAVRYRLTVARAGITNTIVLGINLVAIGVLLVAIALSATEASLGTIVAIIVYVRILEGPLGGTSDARLEISRDLIAFTRVLEVLDGIPDARPAPPPASVASAPDGSLRFDDVSFTYPRRTEQAVVPSLSLATEIADANAPSLEHVSFTVEPGEMVAIVGRTGAGKSTIAMLAAGLLTPSSGRVTIGATAAATQVLVPGQRAVAYVTQDTFLLHDTLRANILYARPGASEDDLRRACVLAGVHDFAWDLSLRYETLVGEKGLRMSGGERQRIALARAILRDPELVILDEATAHMDTQTEATIHHALDEVFASRARLVIAHRLSTIRDADRILVLDHGEIVEQGSHGALLAAGGAYAELCATQLLTPDAGTTTGGVHGH